MMQDNKQTEDTNEPNTTSHKRNYVLTGATYNSVVEKQILEALERGDFDDLPGEGKPLDLSENLYAGDRALAYKLLKDNQFTLPWIADRNDTLEKIADFRAKMKRQWQLHGVQIDAMLRSGQATSARSRWLALASQWHTQIQTLNRRIDAVNLELPIPSLEMLKLSFEVELTRIGAGHMEGMGE